MVPTVVPRTCWCMERKDVAFEYCQSVFARCFWAVGDLGSYFSTTLHHLPLSFTTTPHHSLLLFIHYHAPFIVHHSLQLVMQHPLPRTPHHSLPPSIKTRHASFTTTITTRHAPSTTNHLLERNGIELICIGLDHFSLCNNTIYTVLK